MVLLTRSIKWKRYLKSLPLLLTKGYTLVVGWVTFYLQGTCGQNVIHSIQGHKIIRPHKKHTYWFNKTNKYVFSNLCLRIFTQDIEDTFKYRKVDDFISTSTLISFIFFLIVLLTTESFNCKIWILLSFLPYLRWSFIHRIFCFVSMADY